VPAAHVVSGRRRRRGVGGRQRDGARTRRREQERQEPVQLAGQFLGRGRRPVPVVGQRRLSAGRHGRVFQGPRPVRPGRLLRPGLVPAQRERAGCTPAAGRGRRRWPARDQGVRVLDGTAARGHRVGQAGEIRHAQGRAIPAVGRRRGTRPRRADRGRSVLAPIHRRDILRVGHA